MVNRSSNVLSIYDALAGMDVSVNDEVVVARKLNEVPDSVRAADLPMRLILPYGTHTTGTADRQAFSHLAIGQMDVIDWQILDLFLYRPLPQGQGLRTASRELMEYQGNYAVALAGMEEITQHALVLQATMLTEPREWPIGSDTWYHAVECIVSVRETIWYG